MARKIQQSGAALVTGAAQRIGKTIALALAEKGYHIAVHYYRSRAEAQKTAAEIQKRGVRCELFRCDLASAKDVQKLIRSARKEFKNLNVLVNNASLFQKSSFAAGDLKLFDAHWQINLKAPYILSGGFAKYCRRGHIINILDTHIIRNRTQHAAYLLSKKALAEMTRMTAVAFAPEIRVNGIAPGLILPPSKKQSGYLDRLAKNIPLKRKGSPAHITRSVEFLLDNDYLTGQIIFADGGEHLIT